MAQRRPEPDTRYQHGGRNIVLLLFGKYERNDRLNGRMRVECFFCVFSGVTANHFHKDNKIQEPINVPTTSKRRALARFKQNSVSAVARMYCYTEISAFSPVSSTTLFKKKVSPAVPLPHTLFSDSSKTKHDTD